MPRDLRSLLVDLQRDGSIVDITRNPLAQFGRPPRRYIGAELLPERRVPANVYRERAIAYRTIVANDGTRYSPVQKKKGELIASMLVELGEADIGREITAEEYDALIEILGQGTSMEAAERVLDWTDTVLNAALVDHNERQRWQAIDLAQVTRKGDNGYLENVAYSNPTGHRVNASVVWSNDANDPFESDILPMADLIRGKGFIINRIITATPVITILSSNAKVQARLGSTVINIGGQLGIASQRVSEEGLASIFRANSLPPPEAYDLTYRTQTGFGYFKSRNTFTFVCTTGRDETIDFGDDQEILTDTLGYMAIGRAAGQARPGRVVRLEHFENKPPRIEGEAWETELPVIQDPEGIGAIAAIS